MGTLTKIKFLEHEMHDSSIDKNNFPFFFSSITQNQNYICHYGY